MPRGCQESRAEEERSEKQSKKRGKRSKKRGRVPEAKAAEEEMAEAASEAVERWRGRWRRGRRWRGWRRRGRRRTRCGPSLSIRPHIEYIRIWARYLDLCVVPRAIGGQDAPVLRRHLDGAAAARRRVRRAAAGTMAAATTRRCCNFALPLCPNL
eukprot:scaffold263381_cov32-Tisochrysis_lutea.AAC.2